MNMDDFAKLARAAWRRFEPVFGAAVNGPDTRAVAAEAGLRGDDAYQFRFAFRLAPLGAVGPKTATAVCYSFSPAMVARYVPAIWAAASPARLLEARLGAFDRTLRSAYGDVPDLAEIAAVARELALAAPVAGRPLAAANADLPWPDEPHLQLWQAASTLREHRGDGHIAALQAAGLDPCEALVSFASTGAEPVTSFASREWPESEWIAAQQRLVDRGWISTDGTATDAGRTVRTEIEQLTDRLAAEPYRAIGAARATDLLASLKPLIATLAATGLFTGEQFPLGLAARWQ